MRVRWAKLILGAMVAAGMAPVCFAPDSVTLRVLEETGSRVSLEDPLTFNAGTIVQGLAALGHTDKTPRQVRTTTDNRAFPATLESMTKATWPLLPGLTTKGMLAPGIRPHYYANIQEPEVVKPQFERPERALKQFIPGNIIHPGIRPPSALVDGYAWVRTDKPQIEKPNMVRADFDYSGPPLLFTLPPAMLRSSLFANDPEAMRLFVRTNEVGMRDATRAAHAATHIRRMRSAMYWDNVEASNNPRADYQDGSDYEAKARNTTKALADLRDPDLPPSSPNDPRPSYDSRPFFNPNRAR